MKAFPSLSSLHPLHNYDILYSLVWYTMTFLIHLFFIHVYYASEKISDTISRIQACLRIGIFTHFSFKIIFLECSPCPSFFLHRTSCPSILINFLSLLNKNYPWLLFTVKLMYLNFLQVFYLLSIYLSKTIIKCYRKLDICRYAKGLEIYKYWKT